MEPIGMNADHSREVSAVTPVLEVFDPPMCCASGVCGPQVDPALVRFAADLKWIQEQGFEVRRYNPAQDPLAFAANNLVNAALHKHGEAALPMLLVNGEVVASGAYPVREELAAALGIGDGGASPSLADISPARSRGRAAGFSGFRLPELKPPAGSGGCCGDGARPGRDQCC